MALLIPTGTSTYGDSSSTGGDSLSRKYVLAQFREDANLDWVGRLRSTLSTQELKYKVFETHQKKLKTDRDLWHRIETGVGQATIIIIDPDPIAADIRAYIKDHGITEHDGLSAQGIHNACAHALVKATPLAYLPYELIRAVDWTDYRLVGSLDDFSPDAIRKEIGPGLREAKIFAARAHALFDLADVDSSAKTTRDVFASPLANVLLTELLQTTRHFDVEHPKTLPVLNRAASVVAEALEPQLDSLNVLNQPTPRVLVHEVQSHSVDQLQAADIAAGWARSILDLTDTPHDLGARFERVWWNGTRLK